MLPEPLHTSTDSGEPFFKNLIVEFAKMNYRTFGESPQKEFKTLVNVMKTC